MYLWGDVEYIDLDDNKDNYRTSLVLNKSIEETEYPKWLWFYGIDALKDSNFSGWLHNRLTVRTIENLRVVFVLDSRGDYLNVFCDSRELLYKATMLFRTDIDYQS